MPKTKNGELEKIDFKPNWHWSAWTATAIAIGLYLTQFVVQLAFLIYPALRHWDKSQIEDWFTNSVWLQFFLALASYGAMIWLLFIFMKGRGKSFRDLGWNRRPQWKDLGLAALTYVGYVVALLIVMQVISVLIPGLNLDQKQQVGFDTARHSWQLILVYISLAIVPPLAEETIFRGFLLGSLRKSLTLLQSVLATSLLFAVAHLQLGSGAPPVWTAAIDVFILSLLLCYLRLQTKSLWAGVFLHSLNNTIAFLALFVFMVNIN